MFRQIWKSVEAKARKIRVAKAKRRESKRRTSKEERRKEAEKEEKAEKEKDNRDKENRREVEDLRWRKRSSKIRRSEEVSSRMIPQVDQSFWKES